MVLRAKFENIDDQRQFFIETKNTLGLGSKRLSALVGLPSRGSIESYISCKTSPPVELIYKLEKLSGVKASKFEKVKGIVRRRQRKLMPLELDEANKILENKFDNFFDKIISFIEDGLTIKEITNLLRKYGFRFDSSKVVRAVGTLKKHMLLEVVERINTDNLIILKGNIRKVKGSFSITFYLRPLVKSLSKKRIKIGIKITKNMSTVKLFPLKIGRILRSTSTGNIMFLLPSQLNLKHKSAINVVLNPEEFGHTQYDFIQDVDARKLAIEAKRYNIDIYQFRSTNLNNLGDIAFLIGDKLVIIEITRANSSKQSRFKLGQCLVQRVANPNSHHFIVCKNRLFSKNEINALNFIGTKLIHSEFDDNWENKVINKIIKSIQINDRNTN